MVGDMVGDMLGAILPLAEQLAAEREAAQQAQAQWQRQLDQQQQQIAHLSTQNDVFSCWAMTQRPPIPISRPSTPGDNGFTPMTTTDTNRSSMTT